MKNKKGQRSRIQKTNKKQYIRRKKEKQGAIYKKQYLWYIFFKKKYTKSNTRKGSAYEGAITCGIFFSKSNIPKAILDSRKGSAYEGAIYQKQY